MYSKIQTFSITHLKSGILFVKINTNSWFSTMFIIVSSTQFSLDTLYVMHCYYVFWPIVAIQFNFNYNILILKCNI
jgi:hypothetical protein